MAFFGFIGYPEILVAVICFLFLRLLSRPNDVTLLSWPLVGMLPSLLLNLHHVYDWSTDLVQRCGGTMIFKGPWLTNMDMLWTCDPANVHYILSAHVSNFAKGAEYKEIFDIIGDGIFNLESDSWKSQRKIAHRFIKNRRFQRFVEKTSRKKVEMGLIPVLELVSEQGLVVDLQDVFQRFTFDSTCILIYGIDPGCLSIELPDVPFAKALNDAMEAILFRYVVGESCWKLQRWLRIGKEKKLSRAWETIDHFTAQLITMKREQLLKEKTRQKEEEEDIDLLTSYMEDDEMVGPKSDKFLRDTTFSLLAAGRDTTSITLTWFFWLVSKNPSVETKIIEELKVISPVKEPEKLRLFDAEELSGLAHLHGALCEALRLFPPTPFNHKHPLHQDVLPSGHKVDKHMKIIYSAYAMGRVEGIWGRDCLEFEPERWISERGEIKHEPSYNFVAFGAGPRTCIGNEMAFSQLKTVAAALIYNYQVEVVEGHPVSPGHSVVFHMKQGLKAKVFKRYG